MTFAEIWTAILAGIGGVVTYGGIGGLALIGLVRILDLIISAATWIWHRWMEV